MLPLIIHVEDGEKKTRQEWVFAQSPVHVGRNPLNELVLTDKFCSQWHGIVRFEEGSATFMDLGSTNGTDFDGRVLKKGEPVALVETSDLRIGHTQLRFSRRAAQASKVQRREWTVFGVKASELNAASGAASALAQKSPGSSSKPGVPDLPELYAAYRQSLDNLVDQLGLQLAAQIGDSRVALATSFVERFPALRTEPKFQTLLQQLDVVVTPGMPSAPLAAPASSGGEPSMGTAGLALLDTFVRAYVPDARELRSVDDVQGFLGRLAEVLETYSSAFVELRRGHEQFAQEIAVRTSSSQHPISHSKTSADVLKYLLDWRVKGSARTQELMSGFVELMVHQVALLNGMREGVRTLLVRLGPEAVEQRVGTSKWPFKASSRWEVYLEQHRQFLEEEQQLTAVVFGPEFARAYATVMSDSGDTRGPRT